MASKSKILVAMILFIAYGLLTPHLALGRQANADDAATGTVDGTCTAKNGTSLSGFLVVGDSTPELSRSQDCSAFAGKTLQDLKSQSDSLKRSLLLQEQRSNTAYQQIWDNANVAGTNIYNFNLGLFLGRAEDYDRLVQTLDNANQAFAAGNRQLGLSRTLSVFKQAGDIALRMDGVFSPTPYTKMPSTPKEALEFTRNMLNVARQFAVDVNGTVVSLAKTGDAMQDSEKALISAAALREQISALQRCMNYAPNPKTTVPTPAVPTGDTYHTQLQALSDRAKRDTDAEFNCVKVGNEHRSLCTEPGYMACIQAANKAVDSCQAPYQQDWQRTMEAIGVLNASQSSSNPK